MSIPGVINMRNVFHNPAQYNYASLFQNTLALAFFFFLKLTTPVYLVCSLPCWVGFFFWLYFFSVTPTSPHAAPHRLPPPRGDKEAVKRYVALLWSWMWTGAYLKLAADLKLKTSRDPNCAANLAVFLFVCFFCFLLKCLLRFLGSPTGGGGKEIQFILKVKQMFPHNFNNNNNKK